MQEGRVIQRRLGKTDFEITTIGEQARLVEQLGYDRLVIEETKDDPFIVLAGAQTERR